MFKTAAAYALILLEVGGCLLVLVALIFLRWGEATIADLMDWIA